MQFIYMNVMGPYFATQKRKGVLLKVFTIVMHQYYVKNIFGYDHCSLYTIMNE